MSDVAKRAGVSIATVGRVLHNNGYVSADKRVEIEKAIRELGFVPNRIAQGLKRSESRIFGHMVAFNMNMQVDLISRAFDEAASQAGYTVLTLTGHRGLAEEDDFIRELIGRRVDGVAISSNQQIGTEQVQRLVDAGIPVVMIERTLDMPLVDRIVVDDWQGAHDAVAHMIRNGHRRIGFVGCSSSHGVERDRRRGYADALAAAGLVENPDWIREADDYSVEFGAGAAEAIFGPAKDGFDAKDFPTAIFATSDVLASGVLQHLYVKSLRVPEDVSVVGYDNTVAVLLAPPISSMGLPHERLGEDAVMLLSSRISNREIASRTIIVTPKLADRRTVREVRSDGGA